MISLLFGSIFFSKAVKIFKTYSTFVSPSIKHYENFYKISLNAICLKLLSGNSLSNDLLKSFKVLISLFLVWLFNEIWLSIFLNLDYAINIA